MTRQLFSFLLVAMALAACLATPARAAPCQRPRGGTAVAAPRDIVSQAGLLQATLEYRTVMDPQGRRLFCFQTPDGVQSPTLRVQPGDKVRITLVNRLPASPAGAEASARMLMPMVQPCGDSVMTASSVNIHFHGMNIAPSCHRDEVVRTVVNPGHSFLYAFTVPRDEPAGLYWYHPHIHGVSAAAVLGGASGAIVVGGIEAVQPSVAGLPERLLVVRDQAVPGVVLHGRPTADISLNYVPIAYPDYRPAIINLAPGQQEFWRVLNASSEVILDLRLLYDGHAQELRIVGLDGVPTGSQDGKQVGAVIAATHIVIPPAGRAEFVITGPAASVKSATFATQAIDTGPAGDTDPARPLAKLLPQAAAAIAAMPAQPRAAPPEPGRFAGLDRATVDARRTLYFSEASQGPGGGDGQTDFYITVDGATPALYNPANPPAIVTRQGSVEDWTIENRSTELHEFHIHQIHFQLRQQNGQPVPAAQRQMLDTVQVPYWTGTGPYPSVTLRMDFRGKVVGDFVYHCHILDHEDGGMMAIIRVLPKQS